jgi:hypothetical protein
MVGTYFKITCVELRLVNQNYGQNSTSSTAQSGLF